MLWCILLFSSIIIYGGDTVRVSKRLRDKTMKILCDFYSNNEIHTYVTTKYIYTVGFPKSKNSEHVLKVLKSMGYVDLRITSDGTEFKIYLTDKGRCYFETSSDSKRDFWRKSVITPILISLATNLLIYGLKLFFPLIQEWLNHTP